MSTAQASKLARWRRVLRHLWYVALDKKPSPELLQHLAQAVTVSEQRHSGQVRICIEASLPLSYLLRQAAPRERAITLFGKLRVWDTEHNSGVLIYLLLADRAVEIVADSGISRHVSADQWQALVSQLAQALRSGQTQAGLLLALQEVSTLLEQHFPLKPGQTQANELPDAPWVG